MLRFGDCLNDGPDQAKTPVGQLCSDCEEPIAAGDWGQIVPHLAGPWGDPVAWKPIHGECLLRSVTGGIEHLTAPEGHKTGSCYEGSTLTRRESALAAYAYTSKAH